MMALKQVRAANNTKPADIQFAFLYTIRLSLTYCFDKATKTITGNVTKVMQNKVLEILIETKSLLKNEL